METEFKLRNGYLQPDYDPNKKLDYLPLVVSFTVAILLTLFQIYKL